LIGVPSTKQRQIARLALDGRLATIRQAAPSFVAPRGGWLRAIRESMGLPSQVLGDRLGLNGRTIRRLERSEQDGVVRLDTLARAADALGCDLVYAIVPRRPLEQSVFERALELATAELTRVDHSMALEEQSTGADDERARLLARELVDRGQVTWDA
jgi:predicted DNA-binding mobile mystery protein A